MIEITEKHLRALLVKAWNYGFDTSDAGCHGDYVSSRDTKRVDDRQDKDITTIMVNIYADEAN